VGNLALNWQVFGNDSSIAPDPVLVNGVVYAAIGNTGSATLYALDAKTKNIIWQKAIGATSDPTVANGVLYIGAYDGVNAYLEALDAGTGELIWQVRSDVNPPPIVADGIVYSTSYPHRIHRD
jgi:outer membrane protein assembly factor BamB